LTTMTESTFFYDNNRRPQKGGPAKPFHQKRVRAFLFLIILLVFCGLLGTPFPSGAQCPPQEKIVIQGKVTELQHPIALVKGDDGKLYRVRLGPYWYWKKKGYKLSPGEKIRILGFKKGKLVFPIVITTKGRKYLIRDECGVPLWRKKP